MDEKKLIRPKDNRKLLGVCAGIAKYFDISDVTVIRVIYAAATLFTGCFLGIVLYIVLALVIPE